MTDRYDADSMTAATLSSYLSHSLGQEQAWSVVSEAVKELGISHQEIRRPDALTVLAHLADSPGLIGISSRFAATRLLLQWKPASPRSGANRDEDDAAPVSHRNKRVSSG